MTTCTTYSLIALIVIMLGGSVQLLAGSSDGATNAPDFSSLSYQAASDTVDSEVDLIVGRGAKRISNEYIDNIVIQLRYAKVNGTNKSLAFYLLGELKPHERDAIEVLIENIDFRAPKLDYALGPARWGLYPAKEALMGIGKPVVDPILNHLANESNELRRRLMCEVLRLVEGKSRAQAQIKQKLVEVQANLQSAMKELEQ